METAGGLRCEVVGDGPDVLFIHGSHIADGFAPLARDGVLRDRFRLNLYTRRGFPGSASHTGPFSIEQQAGDALAVARELELGRFHLVGHSYGAVAAIQAALDAPGRVHTLTLLEPPVMSPAQAVASGEMLAPIVELYQAGEPAEAVDRFMQTVAGPDWEACVEQTVPGGAERAKRDAVTFFEVELPALQEWEFDEDAAGRITQPVVCVMGGDSPPFVHEFTEWFRSLVPHAEEVVLPGLNHLLQLQRPEPVAEVIAGFLERHPIS